MHRRVSHYREELTELVALSNEHLSALRTEAAINTIESQEFLERLELQSDEQTVWKELLVRKPPTLAPSPYALASGMCLNGEFGRRSPPPPLVGPTPPHSSPSKLSKSQTVMIFGGKFLLRLQRHWCVPYPHTPFVCCSE